MVHKRIAAAAASVFRPDPQPESDSQQKPGSSSASSSQAAMMNDMNLHDQQPDRPTLPMAGSLRGIPIAMMGGGEAPQPATSTRRATMRGTILQWLGRPNGWTAVLALLAFILGIALTSSLRSDDRGAVSEVGHSKKHQEPVCFQEKQELRNAIIEFLNVNVMERHQSPPALKYGYPVNSWCLSPNMTDLSHVFSFLPHFNEDIALWDVSRIRNFSHTFQNAASFHADLSQWNVEKAVDMNSMFRFAKSFHGDLSTWKVSNLRTMTDMFTGATAFDSDVSGWQVQSVTNFRHAFSRATSFSQNLCAWGPRIQAGADTLAMFKATNCPDQVHVSPDMRATPPGPFCFPCSS